MKATSINVSHYIFIMLLFSLNKSKFVLSLLFLSDDDDDLNIVLFALLLNQSLSFLLLTLLFF